MFDPDSFLNNSAEGEMQTQYEPIPEDDYMAVIEAVKPKQVETKDGPRIVMDVTWAIDNPELAENLGRKNLTVRQSIWLDTTETGTLDAGPNKNVQLGRLREAVGQNGKGKWKPADLIGAGPCLIRVVNNPDKNDPSRIYENVTRVTQPE